MLNCSEICPNLVFSEGNVNCLNVSNSACVNGIAGVVIMSPYKTNTEFPGFLKFEFVKQ